MQSVSFRHQDSFLALEPPSFERLVNLTMTLITEQNRGVILYYGDDPHVAIELFSGRIKVSYYIGNYPVSLMYSYAPGKILRCLSKKNVSHELQYELCLIYVVCFS